MIRIAMLCFSVAVAAMPVLAETGMVGMDKKSIDRNAASETVAGKTHQGIGVVKTVDPAGGVITIAHGAIKSLNWPAMTMSFEARDPKLLTQAKPQYSSLKRATMLCSGFP